MKIRFEKPSDNELIEIAILFNDGKMEIDKLADMTGYVQFVIDRLYEHGNIRSKSSKEIEIEDENR